MNVDSGSMTFNDSGAFMPLNRVAKELAFRPGHFSDCEEEAPGLKPCCFRHGFRGINAPAPSQRANQSKVNALLCREFRCVCPDVTRLLAVRSTAVLDAENQY